jgi:hypothetical protein
MQLYATFADIRVENSVYQSGSDGNKESLAALLNQLDSFEELKQYQQQEFLVAALKLESSYHLGLSEKAYLEHAIEEYDGYTEQTRKNTIKQYYYALCIELMATVARRLESMMGSHGIQTRLSLLGT